MKSTIKYTCAILLSLLPLTVYSAKEKSKPATVAARPRLVVGLVIDQMRWDFLYRYEGRYTAGGFKRLAQEGFNCQNTMINYLPSFTAPGHACIYTGSVPALHGIAANDWYDNLEQRGVYCTEDANVTPIGSANDRAGKMSPANLRASTITDELRLATNMGSRVYGLAIKDRGSILPAGHLANGAYWYDDRTGDFISSSYYGPALPEWIKSFNGQKKAFQYIQAGWETMYPLNTYTQSLADSNVYEGKMKTEEAPVFPHRVSNFDGSNFSALRVMPAGNTIIFDAARACIEGEQLGGRENTDFLCLSFSSTDYAGHTFGPNAVEMEDMYLRLDKDLAEFMAYLDGKLGKDNYLVFLTADHGGAHNARYLQDLRINAGNVSEPELLKQVNAHLKSIYARDSLVREVNNYQVYLNEKLATQNMIDREDLKRDVHTWLSRQKGVAYVIDMENMDARIVPEPLRAMVINGYNRQRSGCLQFILEPGWYAGYAPTGTTHGSWNPYDTHIPLLWYGWKVRPGETYRTVNMTDIAATLAALLHIQMPNACVGEVIGEIMNRD
ncbi:MAG: alkaline phosphatase family protein [Flavipsychrobacter sp.]|nr:alkaline phosphatase family protein [Flavipsychrobacter sp.]